MNIKEIGKELMGKSLNSYHRKLGLTQLEENNKMQDGILNGILSQVDDAYIEKTEQSNVIHLDGSGDGVVVLDNIEGNTMVNILRYKNIQWVDGRWNNFVQKNQLIQDLKTNTEYTIVVDVSNWSYNQGITLCCDDTNVTTYFKGNSISITGNGRYIAKRTTKADFSTLNLYNILYSVHNPDIINGTCNVDMMIFEGDWTDKEIPPYFEGLQSSFEEKANDEGKYEIEILSKNRNMIDLYDENILQQKHSDFKINSNSSCTLQSDVDGWRARYRIPVKKGRSYTLSANISDGVNYPIRINDKEETDNAKIWELNLGYLNGSGYKTKTFIATKDFVNILFYKGTSQPTCDITNIMLTPNDTNISFENMEQNKIKLLINEPLRSISTMKDKLCIKDEKLKVERNLGQVTFSGNEDWQDSWQYSDETDFLTRYYTLSYNEFGKYAKQPRRNVRTKCLSDNFSEVYCFSSVWGKQYNYIAIHGDSNSSYFQVSILKSMVGNDLTKQGFKNWIKNNGLSVVYPLAEPYYEEVLNEYGEPIILEGYENGTLYIDSTIIPTTTVKYTPKMETLNTLKEVYNNNVMLTSDVNDTIIPYMMEVDLMIMEKEMTLMSHKNIRKMEVLDMTSMQKRTQDMLERLIKGKSLTEQECKTRVTTYLNAGKITDEQAEELMLLIDEVYA